MPQEVRFDGNQFKFTLGVRVINNLFSHYAKSDIQVEKLLNKAKTSTGLTDFGDEFFLKPLHILVDEINEYTEFHAMGRFLAEKKILMNLVNRLWATYWVKKEPSIVEQWPPSVLISGLQRTGTTFLQRLLGHLPEFRGVLSWELVNPVPRSKKKKYYGKYQARFIHFMMNYVNPEFKSIHSVRHDSLEEEVVLMDHSFMSSTIEAVLNVPGFTDWLESEDHTKAYEDLKMWLQLLLWRKSADHFLLLKSPHHMEFLDTFMGVLPQTKIINMHRDPARALASYCSMVHFGTKIFRYNSDSHKIGAFWLRKNKRLIDHSLEYKKKHPGQFIDIAYKDLVRDPVQVARSIYEQLGLTWTEIHTKSSLEFCQHHRKNKYGKHSYDLSDYGITPADVQNAFGEYISLYRDYL